MTLRGVNLNLLPILQALLQERSVSRAAARLGMTQPAASKALARLRGLLGDPLLIPVGNRSILSKRAEDILGQTSRALELVADMLGENVAGASPAKRTFAISCIDYVALALMIRLLRRADFDAAEYRITFVDLPLSGAWGHVDFAIVPRPFFERLAVEDAQCARLFEDEMVLISPAAGKAHGDGTLVGVERAGGTIIDLDADAPYRPGPDAAARFSVQQFALLPYLSLLAGETNRVPLHLARLIAPTLSLRIAPLPDPPDRFDFVLAWRKPFARDPAHRRMQRLIEEELGDRADRDPAPS